MSALFVLDGQRFIGIDGAMLGVRKIVIAELEAAVAGLQSDHRMSVPGFSADHPGGPEQLVRCVGGSGAETSRSPRRGAEPVSCCRVNFC